MSGTASSDADLLGDVRPGSRPVDKQITLLIPTLGREMIRNCLHSIVNGSLLPGSVIVIDQGGLASIPEWLDRIATLGIVTKYRHFEETGRAKGLNRGLNLVESRCVVITDDDCVTSRSWLRNIARHLEGASLKAITGRILADGEAPTMGTVLSETSHVSTKPGLLFDRLSGGNFGATMDVFYRAGLFDEDPCIAYSEDGEWAYRALRNGVTIEYAPDVDVIHTGWRDLGERAGQYEKYSRSHAAFFGKYLRRGDPFIALRAVLHFGRAVRRWAAGIMRRDLDSAASGRAYVAGFMPGLIDGMRSEISAPVLLKQVTNEQQARRE